LRHFPLTVVYLFIFKNGRIGSSKRKGFSWKATADLHTQTLVNWSFLEQNFLSSILHLDGILSIDGQKSSRLFIDYKFPQSESEQVCWWPTRGQRLARLNLRFAYSPHQDRIEQPCVDPERTRWTLAIVLSARRVTI
jgi:hypothetical protein